MQRIMKKYEMVILERATASAKPKHSALESWLSPAALRHLVQVGLEGHSTDAADAAELLLITLFGLRITSSDGWDVRFLQQPGFGEVLEVSIGKLKTDRSVQIAAHQHPEVPAPSTDTHPRAEWFAAIRRGMAIRSFMVPNGIRAQDRITKMMHRLLPEELLSLRSGRYVSAKSCRKTMASACNAAGVTLRAISQFGLWGAKSNVAESNYIDRTYPVQPYTAKVWDFLLDVGMGAVVAGTMV